LSIFNIIDPIYQRLSIKTYGVAKCLAQPKKRSLKINKNEVFYKI